MPPPTAAVPLSKICVKRQAFQRETIRQALAQNHHNWAACARMLETDVANLHRLAKRLGLRLNNPRPDRKSCRLIAPVSLPFSSTTGAAVIFRFIRISLASMARLRLRGAVDRHRFIDWRGECAAANHSQRRKSPSVKTPFTSR